MYEILILFLILVDQVSKIKIESLLKTGGSVPVIDGFFNLTYVQNRGAAFGLFQDKQTVFIMVAVLVVVLGLAYIHKSKATRSEEHTSELQSRQYLVCRLLLEKKKKRYMTCY